MFVYNIGTIDNFKGLVKLSDYIKLCNGKASNDWDCYLSHKELKGFLIKCFLAVDIFKIGWEGDIRFDNVYISVLHGCTHNEDDPLKSIVFKQDGNGTCFIAAEYPIFCTEHDDNGKDDKKTHQTIINEHILFDRFEKMYDLVENLFEDNFPSNTPKKSIQNDKSTKVQDKKEWDVNSKEEVKPDEKFNVTEYEPF